MVSYFGKYNFIMTDRNDGHNYKNKTQTNKLELPIKSPLVSDSLRETLHIM